MTAPAHTARNPHIAEARKRWPAAEWIAGGGQWASVAHCCVTTVELLDTKAQADTAKAWIDRFAWWHSRGPFKGYHLPGLDRPPPTLLITALFLGAGRLFHGR